MFTTAKNSVLDAELITKALEYNETRKVRYAKLYDYYEGDHDILRRKKLEVLSNIKTVTNHAEYITNVNIGYLLGNPIAYQGTEESINLEVLNQVLKNQFIAIQDSTIAKDLSICGTAYDYTYTLSDGVIKTKKIDPRNAVVIYDSSLEHEPMYGITYSAIETVNKQKKFINVMVVDKFNIYEYDEDLNVTSKTPHFFNSIPLVEYRNNESAKGDFESVISLIDAYNILQSDRVNDKEQLVASILAIFGTGLTEDIIKNLKLNRVMGLPKDADAKYITKQLEEANMDILRKALKEDIHKISMTPDFSDENFIGNTSGVALKYKLLVFEQNTQNKQLFFEKSLTDRIKLYINYLSRIKRMPVVDISKIKIVFTRNLPQNDFETSQTIANLDGMVSRETLISQLSFVDDAKGESEKASEESLERATAMSDQFGSANESEDETTTDEEI